MDYAEAVEKAPPGWRHFGIHDVARLPDDVRTRELSRIPSGEPDDRVVRALFWTLVYHLEPERWDELARYGLYRPFDPSGDPANSEVNHIQLIPVGGPLSLAQATNTWSRDPRCR